MKRHGVHVKFVSKRVRALIAMHQRASALQLQQTASSLTLLTLLAIVPIASIALAGLTALPALAQLRQSLERFVAEHVFLPSISATVLAHINTFATAAEKLSALGTTAFLATALMAMLTIDRTLNGIWHTARPRPLSYRLALYWALLTLGPVLLGAALALQFKVVARLHALDTMAGWVLLAQVVLAALPVSLLAVGLTLVYRLVPNAAVRWRDAAWGALVAVLMVLALKQLLVLYVTWMPTYTLVYGAFSVLPVLLLWLFAMWLSVLWGALFAAHAGEWAGRAPSAGGTATAWPPGVWFACLAKVVVTVVQAPAQRLPATEFQALFAGDAARAVQAAQQLVDLGYVVRVRPVERAAHDGAVWDELWLAGAGWETMTLARLFEAVWGRSSLLDDPDVVRAEGGSLAAEAVLRPLAAWVERSSAPQPSMEWPS